MNYQDLDNKFIKKEINQIQVPFRSHLAPKFSLYVKWLPFLFWSYIICESVLFFGILFHYKNWRLSAFSTLIPVLCFLTLYYAFVNLRLYKVARKEKIINWSIDEFLQYLYISGAALYLTLSTLLAASFNAREVILYFWLPQILIIFYIFMVNFYVLRGNYLDSYKRNILLREIVYCNNSINSSRKKIEYSMGDVIHGDVES